MFCKNCGAQLSDHARFCNKCGAKQPEMPAAPENTTTPAQVRQTPPPVQPQKPEPAAPQAQASSNKGLIAIIVILIILVLGLGGWVIFTSLNGDKDDDSSSKGGKESSSAVDSENDESSQSDGCDSSDTDSSENDQSSGDESSDITTTTAPEQTTPSISVTEPVQSIPQITDDDSLEKLGVYKNGNHYYKVYQNDGQFNYYDSLNDCKQRGGYLVAINDASEQNFITTLFGDKDYYWIGLYKDTTDKWMLCDNSVAVYFNWDHYTNENGEEVWEPDNYEERENVGRVSTKFIEHDGWQENRGGWHDTDGTGKGEDLSLYGYICEWDSVPDLDKIN